MFCEEQEALRVAQQRDRDEQRRYSQEMSRLLDTVQGMTVDLVHLGRRTVEVEISATTSEPRPVPPLPQYPSVPTPVPVISSYELPAPTMPVVPPPGQTGSGQIETTRPRQIVTGECACGDEYCGERWDVDCFLRNGGRLFYGSMDPEEALIWLDTARSVLEHLGCQLDLRVRMAIGAMLEGSRV